MDSLSIIPAIDLMKPAVIPFAITAGLLFILGRLSFDQRKRRLPDLAALKGVLLVFFLFDRQSILHLFDPERPMDWIPALALAAFVARILSGRLRPWVVESLTIGVSSFILLFPLLHRAVGKDLLLFPAVLALWLLAHHAARREGATGIGRAALLPLFLSSATLGALSPLSGSLLLGQLSGGLAAVWLAMILIRPGLLPLSGVEPGIALGGLLLIAREYVEIPPVVVGALYGAILLGLLSDRLLAHRTRLPAGVRLFLPSLLSLVFIGVAVMETLRLLQSTGSAGY
ncbi:MAG: hypothetical protein ACP5OS_00635 [Leptospirillia bacterium]